MHQRPVAGKQEEAGTQRVGMIDDAVHLLIGGFSLLPYSAAQQPVQCRLQADVGSGRMAQGMLQPYFSACFCCS